MKKITDYAELIKAKHALNKTIAPVEDGASMTGSYTSGQQFIRDGVLCTALTSIAAGTAFSSLTLDTDYEVADDITSQLSSVNSALSNTAYLTSDTTENTLASDDVLPFYDTSATAKRKMTVQKFGEQLISNPNLLDNPWFTVNQRGQSSYSVNGNYFVDRWVTEGQPTIVVSSSGLAITTTANGNLIKEFFESALVDSLLGKTVTLSILLADGTLKSASASIPSVKPNSLTEYATITIATGITFALFLGGSGNSFVQLFLGNSGSTLNVKAVKLELGSVSTLAMDTAPNYATELLKCQRYFYRLSASYSHSADAYCGYALGESISATKAIIALHIPVKMRAVPTITQSGAIAFAVAASGSYIDVTVTISSIADNILMLYGTGTGLTAGNIGILTNKNDANAYIDISADL